jgi:hypothetical protein
MYSADHNRPIRGKSWVELVAHERHALDSKKPRSLHFCVKASEFPAAMYLSVPESRDYRPTVPHSTIRFFSASPACAATMHCWPRKAESPGFFVPSTGFCACSESWDISVRSAFTMRAIHGVRQNRAGQPDVAPGKSSLGQIRRPSEDDHLRLDIRNMRAKPEPRAFAAGGWV